MRKLLTSKIGALILAVVVLASIGISLALVAHLDPLCGEELIVEKLSPDGQYVATLMSRNCGATTPYVAHINLRQANSELRRGFFNGTVNDGLVFVSSKYSGERFCWSNQRQLDIGYPDSDGSQATKTWRDVTIRSGYKIECP
jgi:hypothetical protein